MRSCGCAERAFVGAYLAQSPDFLLNNPGFGYETVPLRAPEPPEAVTDYGTGIGSSDAAG